MPPQSAASRANGVQTTLSFGRSLSITRPETSSAALSTVRVLPGSPTVTGSAASTSGTMMSDASSIPSSAGGYARRREATTAKKEKDAATVIRVHLSLRPLSGNSGLVVSTLSLKREAITIPGLRRVRSKYDKKAKEKIIDIAKQFVF